MRDLNNLDLRTKARESNVCLWEVAERLNISDPTLTRKLRHELSDSEKKTFY